MALFNTDAILDAIFTLQFSRRCRTVDYSLDGETVEAELWQCRRADQHVSEYFHGFFITIIV